jgi:hypothetical protein
MRVPLWASEGYGLLLTHRIQSRRMGVPMHDNTSQIAYLFHYSANLLASPASPPPPRALFRSQISACLQLQKRAQLEMVLASVGENVMVVQRDYAVTV